MSRLQPMPCPVLLGTVETGGLPALLHKYTIEKKVAKMEKVLKKGVRVDSTNNFGQTPLFCASLLGFTSVAEKLLHFGANPNHRCNDGSTPIHAAVFSCNPWLLSSLLDAGGDLRLHDDQGRVPKDWAEAGAQENSPKILAFLKRCETQMHSLLQSHLFRDAIPTSSKTLLNSPSMLKLLRPWGSGLIHENQTSYKLMQCFGYGKICFEKPMMSLGLSASLPLISDSDLGQANDEPLNSFMCGSFIQMTNYSWKGCRVTVKELHGSVFQQRKGHDDLLDLLIAEQEYCCQVSHPHLLLLMAVSFSADLDSTKLVYERVNLGSLYSLLHQRRDEFPLLQLGDLLSVVLQVCEVLMYLHGRSLVLRALSSHMVLIVHPGVAKVTGLGFMSPSAGTCSYSPPLVPVPLSVINWAAPEVIRCRECTGKADLYSVCALIQEIYTDAVPWGFTEPRCIKRSVESGQALVAHPAVPEPFNQFLQTGLQHRAQQRTNSLHDLCYNLRSYIREIRSEEKKCGWHTTTLQSIPAWKTDIDHTRQQEYDEYHHYRTTLQNVICTEEEVSTTDTDNLQRDTSHSDITPSHEWPITHHASLSEPPEFSDTDKDLAISRSISKQTGSIVLNLKVSQVLLQQAEQSLDNVEAGLSDPCFDEVDAVSKRVSMKEEYSNGVCKAVGPPSYYYRPKWIVADEEVSQYISALDESCDRTSCSSSVKEENFKRTEAKRRQQQTGCQTSERLHVQFVLETQKDSTQRSLAEHYQTKPTWTSEVSEMVALMARGRLWSAQGAVGSSDSEDVEEQQLHLQGWQDHSSRQSVDSYQDSETQESTDLEPLFKSFAGIQSDSEESTNYSTVDHTLDVTNEVLKDADQTEDKESSECSDYKQTHFEASSIFYTPKHHLSSNASGEEHSQSLSSEDELDVTVEVCRPSMTPAEELSEYQLAQEDLKESESITPVHSLSSHLPDSCEIANISSIPYSPAQHQQMVGSPEAPPTHNSRGRPTCNSTPRTPKGRRTHLKGDQVGTEQPFQSLSHMSPQGSAPSHAASKESCTTTDAGDCNISPAIEDVSKEETDCPSSADAELNRQTSDEMELPTDKNDNVDKDGEEIGDLSDSGHQCEKESSNEKVFVHEGISKKKDDQRVDLNGDDVDTNTNSQSQSQGLDETEKASSTLDEILQGMHLERDAEQRTEDPESLVSQSDLKGIIREHCPDENYIETAECIHDLGEEQFIKTIEAALWDHHQNRALMPMSPKSVKQQC